MAHFFTLQIVLVDDASNDDTRKVIQSLAKSNQEILLVLHARNYGQSAAIYSGVKAADHNLIATLDGDGQNIPGDIIKLLKHAEKTDNKKSLFVGCRVKRNDGLWRLCCSKIANYVRSSLLKDGCPDTGSGIKLFLKQDFMEIPHFKNMHRFLPALFKRNGGKIINITVGHRDRQYGSSKYNTLQRLFAGIYDLIGVNWIIARKCNPEVKIIKHVN